MKNTLVDDAAYVMAVTILEVVGPCLRDEERNDALQEFFHIAQTGLESFLIQRSREAAKWNPSMN